MIYSFLNFKIILIQNEIYSLLILKYYVTEYICSKQRRLQGKALWIRYVFCFLQFLCIFAFNVMILFNAFHTFVSAFILLKYCWYGVNTYSINQFILHWIDPSREFCVSNPRKSLHILIYTWLSYSLRKQFLACHTFSAFGHPYLSSSTSPRNISSRYVLQHNIKTTTAGII